ncbi:MAG: DUF47 family protein [Candidatus Cloacimonetes bacterium]|nr:DUF47 family protein [Candidatus Cloacimonadota bacterium]
MTKIFNNKTKELVKNIDCYIENVSNSGLIFYNGIKAYMNNDIEKFELECQRISILETEADDMRRDIKHKLYRYMLIPDSRGDVLGLLETLDGVVDTAEKILEQLSIETPLIPDFLRENFIELAEFSYKAVDELIMAVKAFFREINSVDEHVNQVLFFEHEADNIEESIKRKIFQTDKIPRFSKKLHTKYFVEKIALVSDVAESVAERLSIYAIKRRI